MVPEQSSSPPPAATQGGPYEPLKTRLIIVGVTTVISLILDRWTKVLATEHLWGHPRMSFLGDTFRLDYAKNSGAFLSLGSGLPESVRGAVFTWAVAALLAFLTYLCLTRPHMHRRMRLALALVLSGGLGNLYDRVMQNGLVTDFMNMGLGPLRTGIFNVADVAIVAGVVLLALPDKKPKSASEAPAPSATPPDAGSRTEP